MPIRTADCKSVITEFFGGSSLPMNIRRRIKTNPLLTNVKNWKRISKRGNAKKGFIRQFINKECPGFVINVHSTEDVITKVVAAKDTNNVSGSAKTGNLQARLQEIIRKDAEEAQQQNHPSNNSNIPSNSIRVSGYDLLMELEFASVPVTPAYSELPEDCDIEEDYYEQGEQLDFENCEITDIDGETIHVMCGGDWQWPGWWSATLGKDGKMHYNNDVVWDSNKKELEGEELLTKVFGKTIPSEYSVSISYDTPYLVLK